MNTSGQANPRLTPPNFDEELDQAITNFRTQHKLPEDDAVLLLVELFRIHQQHWDALRRREMPSYEPFRADITSILNATKTYQQQNSTLIETFKTQAPNHPEEKITLTAAIFAVMAALIGGYLIGRGVR